METHSPSIHTQNNQDLDLGVTSTDGSHVNDASDNFLQHESHNVHYVQNTDDEDDKRTYDFRGMDPNHGQRAPTDPLDETPRSLSPFDYGLNILSQSIDATGETTESFFQGQMAYEAENEGLSINIPLASNYRDSINSASHAPYWDEGNAYIKGFIKSVQTFENLEYSVNDAGQEEISRQEGPPTHDESRNSMQTKWLHLQSATMDLDILQQFVMECHLIGDDVKTVTIELVKRAGKKYLRHSETGPYIEPGSVLRGIGNYSQQSSLSQKARPTVPVVFVASPYLRLRPLKGHQNGENRGDYHPRTLLQNLYGFDVTPNRDKTQIVRKIGNGSQLNNALHVNQMWCLLIGPTLLITMSDHTTQELLDGTIGERGLRHESPIKIKIIDDKQNHHDIAVSSSITWVDLFKITMDTVQKKRSDFHYYDLRDEKKVIITAERWIEIVSPRSLQKSQSYTIYLTPRPNNTGPRKDRLFLEYKRHDASGTLDELPTKHRHSDASSGRVGSSRKESHTHESADQLTSNTASSPFFLYQGGTGFIVSSPEPQDPDEFYNADKDSLGIISHSHETESVEGTNTTMPLGIDNSLNAREAPEASSTGNFANLQDDVASNVTNIDGTINLPKTNNHRMNHKKIRHKKIQTGAEISVESYPSVQEDDPKASNDMFLKQLFFHKQRQSQSQGSIPSLTSKHFPGANAGSISSRRDSLRIYHMHQHADSQYHLPPPIITNLNSRYPRRQGIVGNDETGNREYALRAKNMSSGSASHSHHRKRDAFIKQRPATSITSDLANDKHSAANPQGSKSAKIVPFFLWGPCIPTSSNTLRSAKEADMIKLLDEADEAISNSQVGIYYYIKVPGLTEEEFLSRQDIPGGGFQEDDLSTVKESSTYRNVGPTAADITVKDDSLLNSVSKVDHASGNAHLGVGEVKKNNIDSEITLPAMVQDDVALKQAQSLGILSPDKELMEQLVTVSRQILWSFLPKTGSSTVHPLLKRYWGCMDIIRRQLIWEESEREPHDVPTYIIRDFSTILQRTGRSQSPNSQKTLLAKCGDCKGGKHYSSAEEALKHFHDEHFDCHHRVERPYDDPCYSWLHRIWHSHYPVRNERNGLLHNVQEFERELSELVLQMNELHAMVTSKEDDSMGDLAIRPPLPKHIFYAFQKIVQVFVLRSKRLSLMTRIKTSSGIDLSKISDKINELQRFEKTAKDRMLDLLDHAKRDIFLSGNTSSDIERPQPQAVGAEFLALAFICKSHNLLFEAGTSKPRRNDDTLKLYKHYTSELHFQANQRPQKRVFLDIRDLEEELDALDTLLSHQKECLHKFAKSISPDTLRLTTMTRVMQNRAEKAYQDSHTRQLDRRIQEVQNMKTRSRFLKEQVKQTIEIMEEDHGKAIRVFTIVTLFFLPLSFVSSFMGMNTADVRNMHYKQGLFWATGIPVTLFVLTLACIYGYKGDEIRDWALQRSHCPKNNNLRLPMDGEDEVGEDYHNVHDVSFLPSTRKPRRAARQRRLKSRLPHGNEGDYGSREQGDDIVPLARKETPNSLTLLHQISGSEVV